nr:MAG TPA: hypothetical protein [Caudoviricetes sp.]
MYSHLVNTLDRHISIYMFVHISTHSCVSYWSTVG